MHKYTPEPEGETLPWENEAIEILWKSEDIEVIQLVCRLFPFKDQQIPSKILLNRKDDNNSAKLSDALCKAKETIQKNIEDCTSLVWDWTSPTPLIIGAVEAARIIDNGFGRAHAKLKLVALTRKACGFHSVAVDDYLNGIDLIWDRLKTQCHHSENCRTKHEETLQVRYFAA